MFLEIKFDKEKARSTYRGDDKQFEEFCNIYARCSNFKKFPAYRTNAVGFISFLEEYQDMLRPDVCEYGFALTVEAVEKYILDNYGGKEGTYIVEVGIIPFDLENLYKWGTYVNLKGEMTYDEEFNDVASVEEANKVATRPDYYIDFTVFEITED